MDQDSISTKLTIHNNRPTAVSSTAHGSNLDALGFNISFLAQRNPKLAIELLKLYSHANKVSENDPKPPEEDFALFEKELSEFGSITSDKDLEE